MNMHEPSLRLAAAAVTEPLSAREASDLEEHLRSCGACRRQYGSLADDHRRLRRLVTPRPVRDDVRAAVLTAVATGRGPDASAILLVAALLGLLLMAIVAFAGGQRRDVSPLDRFAGSWTATNCATHSLAGSPLNFDCDRWGDGSALTLVISPDEPATVRITGVQAPGCSGTGMVPSTPPLVRDGTFLWVQFDDVRCGDASPGPGRATLFYLEPNGDRIWLDPDGDEWGLFWLRQE